MNKVIRGGARDIVYKVYMWCIAEFQAGKLLCNLEDVYHRTADFTGVSVSTVRRIVQHGIENGGKFSTPAKHMKGRPMVQTAVTMRVVQKSVTNQYQSLK